MSLLQQGLMSTVQNAKTASLTSACRTDGDVGVASIGANVGAHPCEGRQGAGNAAAQQDLHRDRGPDGAVGGA